MLRSRVTDIMARGDDDYPIFSLATPLWGVSMFYGGLARLRRRLYARGRLKSRRLPCPVISVGNLALGGTGKTPLVVHLAERIRKMGYRPVILSRGYRGLAEKNGAVVSNGRNLLCDARQAGDEPYLMAALLPAVPVVVGRDRYRNGMDAARRFQPDLMILDDGFQHLQLKRDLDLLLLDAQRPFGNGHILPRGTLREPAASLLDADAVVLTRCRQAGGGVRDDLIRRAKPRPVFSTDHQPAVRKVLASGQPVGAPAIGCGPDPGIDFKEKRVFAFAGLGSNEAFFHAMAVLGARLQGTQGFDDHHPFTGDDLGRIVKMAQRVGANTLMTTDKDFVRLPPDVRLPFELIVMGVRIDFGEQSTAWREYIERVVRQLMER
jgi:tetraacyldisaccharide 4'-kinase